MGAMPPSTTGSAILDVEARLLADPEQGRALPPAETGRGVDSVRGTSSALPPGVFFALCTVGYAVSIALLLFARLLTGETAKTLQVFACAAIAANAAVTLMRARSLGR